VSQSGAHLKAGQLGTADVTASAVANIGPGIDFYFGFGVIAVNAGVAAPLTILAATVAVALLAFTASEFTRAEPSAGSFITYVETALGARAGVATAVLVTVGYTIFDRGSPHHVGRARGLDSLALHLLASPVGAVFPRPDRGRDLADRTRGQAVDHGGRRGRDRSGSDHGRGVSPCPDRSAGRTVRHTVLLGTSHRWPGRPVRRFPAGTVHVHRMGKRTRARRGEPRSTAHHPEGPLHLVATAAALSVFFAYATITGFRYNVSSIGRSSVPFLTVADHYLGGASALAWIAGIVSVLATLVAGADSQSRMRFDGGRTGLLPAKLGHLRRQSQTPVNALLFMAVAGLGIIGVWWVAASSPATRDRLTRLDCMPSARPWRPS